MRRRALLVVLALLAVPGVPARAEGGGVWTPTLGATQGFDKLSLFPNRVAYAQYLDTYAKSTDAGLSWTVMPRPPRQYLGSPGIRFATPTIGWSVAGGTGAGPEDLVNDGFPDEIKRCGGLMPLQRTTDGGTTWRAVCVPHSRLVDQNPGFSVSGSPLAVGRDGKTVMLEGNEWYASRPAPACGADHDVIYSTRDAGVHWNRAALPKGWLAGYRSQVYDSSTMLHLAYYFTEGAECSSGTVGLFVSHDGGRSFRKTYVCRVQPTCTSVVMVSRSRILLGRTDGSTLVTSDGGKTWRLGQRMFEPTWQPSIDSGAMSPWSFWVQSMAFSDPRHGYASTRGSGTWRTVDGGFSWRQERSHECAWYIPGIGEIAAGSATTAITGGPHFISARTETPLPSQPCVAPRPQAGPELAWQALDGSAAIRTDGVYVRR